MSERKVISFKKAHTTTLKRPLIDAYLLFHMTHPVYRIFTFDADAKKAVYKNYNKKF